MDTLTNLVESMIEQLVDINQGWNHFHDSREEMAEYYADKLSKRLIRCMLEGDKIVAFVDYSFIASKDQVAQAQMNQAEPGDYLYVNHVYAAPGYGKLLFKLRRFLPTSKGVFGHRLRDHNRVKEHGNGRI